MSDEMISPLVPSTTRGRYALDDPGDGHELTSGEPIVIVLGGHWIPGRVEHGSLLSPIERSGQTAQGYYFIAGDGHVCGLCTGMQVRLVKGGTP